MKSHSKKTTVHFHGHLYGWATKEIREMVVVLKKTNSHTQTTKASRMRKKTNELVLVNPKSQRIKDSKTIDKHKKRQCHRVEKDSSRKTHHNMFTWKILRNSCCPYLLENPQLLVLPSNYPSSLGFSSCKIEIVKIRILKTKNKRERERERENCYISLEHPHLFLQRFGLIFLFNPS